MHALLDVSPTPEQLSLISRIQPGVEIIRGAAGSGKTTTALLKLRSLIGSFINRRRRQQSKKPINILVLTYNKTLSGYISELANKQFLSSSDINLEVSTFGKWAINSLLLKIKVCDDFSKIVPEELSAFCLKTGLSVDFVKEEIEYLTGKFMPEDIHMYLNTRRDGRGGTPRMPSASRTLLLEGVVYPYIIAKQKLGLIDWNDIAVKMVNEKFHSYDIVVADETQDFSGNQIRAVMNQLAEIHAVTFILDSAQRIYARGFTWSEVGISIRPENSFRLKINYRNTKQIANFAASILSGLLTDDDGTLPDFSTTMRNGSEPVVLMGGFDKQVEYAINLIKSKVNLSNESVAFLHPLGGGWFKRLIQLLENANLAHIQITRKSEWSNGPENIALSTLHSAKGLEFDHVFILGLNSEVMPHGEGDEDEKLIMQRRLVAMGVGRAKTTVIIGFKPEDASTVVQYMNADTFIRQSV